MGGAPQHVAVRPEVVVDGAAAATLAQALRSVVVHCVDETSSIRLEVAGRLRDLLPAGVEPGTTGLAVRLAAGVAFDGRLDRLDLRAPEGEPSSLVLAASGTAPRARTRRPVSLVYGSDLTAVSVRRGPGSTTARGEVTSPRLLRLGTRVELGTPDPDFDGVFTVVELWYRYDQLGSRIEFLAEA